MEKIDALKEIQQELTESGENMLSMLLSNTIERQSEKSTHTIGIIGDDLAGKSTIINSILGEPLLPTTVIPSAAEITIKYGNERAVYDRNGSLITDSDLAELVEEKDFLVVSTDNEFLKDNSLVFKEFRSLLNKPKIDDMELIVEVSKYDAVILVMTAEHLLSKSEKNFIDNFVKYVGAGRILLVINKLSAVAEKDIFHVLDYAKKQILLKFNDIKWTIFDPTGRYEDVVKKYTSVDLKNGIIDLFDKNQAADDRAVTNMLSYIQEQLEIQRADLESLEGKNKEEALKQRERRETQKALEKAFIDGALIEFQQKRNHTNAAIDNHIKDQFERILSEMVKGLINSSNKYSWCENELETIWNRKVLSASEKVDAYASSEIAKDIEWLNDLLKTKFRIPSVSLGVSESKLDGAGDVMPYEMYKKYALLGTAGGVLIGYCLSQIVGAAIGLSGGLVSYSYLGIKDLSQTEEIQRKLRSKIRDISYHVRKLSQEKIEKIYEDALSAFRTEATKMLDEKYGVDYVGKSRYIEQCKKIDKLIKKIEEV